MPPKTHKPNCDYFRNPEHCNCEVPPKTNEELIADTVLAIVNTDLMDTDINAWEQLVEDKIRTLLTSKDQEREAAVKAERERVQNLPDFKSLMELATPNAEFLSDGNRITHFCKVTRQLKQALTPADYKE